MLHLLLSITLAAAGAIPGNFKTSNADHKPGLHTVLVYLLEYWWVIAATLVLATLIGFGVWLIKRSPDDSLEKEVEDLEPVLYLTGRKIKTIRSNIFKFEQSEKIKLDPV